MTGWLADCVAKQPHILVRVFFIFYFYTANLNFLEDLLLKMIAILSCGGQTSFEWRMQRNPSHLQWWKGYLQLLSPPPPPHCIPLSAHTNTHWHTEIVDRPTDTIGVRSACSIIWLCHSLTINSDQAIRAALIKWAWKYNCAIDA